RSSALGAANDIAPQESQTATDSIQRKTIGEAATSSQLPAADQDRGPVAASTTPYDGPTVQRQVAQEMPLRKAPEAVAEPTQSGMVESSERSVSAGHPMTPKPHGERETADSIASAHISKQPNASGLPNVEPAFRP